MNKQLQHGSIHHKENGGKELKVGSGGGRERKTIQGKDFCIDTQAVITVYVPATSVSGENGERQGFKLGG